MNYIPHKMSKSLAQTEAHTHMHTLYYTYEKMFQKIHVWFSVVVKSTVCGKRTSHHISYYLIHVFDAIRKICPSFMTIHSYTLTLTRTHTHINLNQWRRKSRRGPWIHINCTHALRVSTGNKQMESETQ